MKKGEIYEGVVERIDFPNKGRVHVEGETVTVKNAIPGQKIRFQINKKRKNRMEGRLLEVTEKSPMEKRDPVCSIFPSCGGCMYQTMSYEDQLAMKAGQVKKLLDDALVEAGQVNEAGEADYPFLGIKGSPKEFAYRNKMEFSFGDEYKDGPLSLGLHKKGSTYDVLTACDCKIVHEDFTKILTCVLAYFKERNASYYHKISHEGYLRHLLVRRAENTGEILVNLVTTSQEEWDLMPLVQEVLGLPLEGKVVGFLHIINGTVQRPVLREIPKNRPLGLFCSIVTIQNHMSKIAAMQLSFAHVITSLYKLCQMSLRMRAFDVHIVIICMALNSYHFIYICITAVAILK